ncbi:lipase/acyltransferase domain-containing protein [Streptomyces sp. NPDC003832]
MRHPVVLLPGILGSVLEGPAGPLWAPGLPVLRALAALRDPGAAGHPLSPDPQGPPVTASRLFPDVAVLPGLIRIRGYSQTEAWLRRHFAVHDVPGGGLLTFPYDWRLDNRVHAHRLAKEIDAHLRAFRERTGAGEAKAVIVAHSMGGLIARYYLEVLGGWRDCRALITLGTPHRGSPRALDALANGHRHLPGVAALTRRLPSVHQLLPVYPVLDAGPGHRRLAEAGPLPGPNPELLADAVEFHREIETAAGGPAQGPRVLVPVVGTGQRATLQSARLDGGAVRCTTDPPGPRVPAELADGDGTVPRLSAMPARLPEYRCRFVAEAHGALQLPRVLTGQLLELLRHLQLPDLRDILGPATAPPAPLPAAISSELDDAYPGTAPVLLRARAVGGTRPPTRLHASVTGDDGAAYEVDLRRTSEVGDTWYEAERTLPPGLYGVLLTADSGAPEPDPVRDCFAVLPDGAEDRGPSGGSPYRASRGHGSASERP